MWGASVKANVASIGAAAERQGGIGTARGVVEAYCRSMTSSDWQAVVQKLFPRVYGPSWHTSLHAFVCGLAAKLGEGGAAGGAAVAHQQGWGSRGGAAGGIATAGASGRKVNQQHQPPPQQLTAGQAIGQNSSNIMCWRLCMPS